MKGTVEPSSSSAIAALTCGGLTFSSLAIFWVITGELDWVAGIAILRSQLGITGMLRG